MNMYSDYLQQRPNGHIPTEQEAQQEKSAAFARDAYKVKAITENGRFITLGRAGAQLGQVDLVSGIWRVQKKFVHKIIRVRDKDVVLTEKLHHKESTKFEYWNAKMIGYNCYGPFIYQDKSMDLIVAKYDTYKGPRWGYGTTIEAARAFLGLKLWDEYKDVIHIFARRDKTLTK